ncbi:hypothetical protein VSH64_20180 [Amycolatopsis rhabdoformis]|uniref:Cell division protein FtsL n=1 Tax=Amycolatopsis rhabdoformis TaxID=1448059 RepID=A0ABZ1IJJ8_9PSEU|nr:hypothetical protein [Amycolatopsis rhabdoformis]WSE34378.1 hypothetical protein VSH64_20180 [Amycolatopsis rhabdoformis]
MTAPAKSRRRSAASATHRSAPAATTVEQEPQTTRTTDQPETTPRRSSRGRTTAAERAYARRAQRADLLQQREPRRAEPRPARAETEVAVKPKRLLLRWPRSRASFVLVMMGLLAVGVASTLWLTTQAIADSYRLEQLRTTNANLAEAKDRLERDVAKAQSPASLAPAAKQLGMVPGGDPARIVVGPDGKTTVVGEPTKAQPAAGSNAVTPPAQGTSGQPAAGQQEGGIEGDLPSPPAGQ